MNEEIAEINEILVSEDASVKETMRKIDRGGLGIAAQVGAFSVRAERQLQLFELEDLRPFHQTVLAPPGIEGRFGQV